MIPQNVMVPFDFISWQTNGCNVCYQNGETPAEVYYDAKLEIIKSKTLDGYSMTSDTSGVNVNGLYEYNLKFYSVSGNTLENKIKRPPIGLVPRKLHNESRIKDIIEAMSRFMYESKQIPLDWIDELYELSKWNENK